MLWDQCKKHLWDKFGYSIKTLRMDNGKEYINSILLKTTAPYTPQQNGRFYELPNVPKGVTAREGIVCKLNKSLYGLKQASRCWNEKFNSLLQKFNFVQNMADPCVYYGNFKNEKAYLALYVDGLVFVNSQNLLNSILNHLKLAFEISIGNANYFVGMQIERVRENAIIFIHQQAYEQRMC